MNHFSKEMVHNVRFKMSSQRFAIIEVHEWAIDSFHWIAISPNGMKENCPDKIDAAFINAVLECTGDGFKKENNMREDEKEVNRFTEIEDFIKAANFLEITDILASFWFVNNEIDVDKMIKWEPKLHIVRGFCYIFESREVPVFMANDEMLSEKLSNLELELDVSLILIY